MRWLIPNLHLKSCCPMYYMRGVMKQKHFDYYLLFSQENNLEFSTFFSGLCYFTLTHKQSCTDLNMWVLLISFVNFLVYHRRHSSSILFSGNLLHEPLSHQVLIFCYILHYYNESEALSTFSVMLYF